MFWIKTNPYHNPSRRATSKLRFTHLTTTILHIRAKLFSQSAPIVRRHSFDHQNTRIRTQFPQKHNNSTHATNHQKLQKFLIQSLSQKFRPNSITIVSFFFLFKLYNIFSIRHRANRHWKVEFYKNTRNNDFRTLSDPVEQSQRCAKVVQKNEQGQSKRNEFLHSSEFHSSRRAEQQ